MVRKQTNRRTFLSTATGLGLLGLGTVGSSKGTQVNTDGSDFEFHVEVVETNAPIVWGETLEFTVEVENRGYDESSQSISYELSETGAGGTEIDDGGSSASLGGWESEEIEFSANTEKRRSDRRILISVSSEDRRNSETVTFEATQPDEFELAFVELPEEVVESEEFSFDISIENLGHETGSRDLTYHVGNSTVEGENVELGWREKTEKTVTIPAEALHHGTRELAVETEDDTISTEIHVLERATFQIDFVSVEPVSVGETVLIESRIMNTGDVQGEMDVEIDIDDIGEEVGSISVEPSDSNVLEFEIGADDIEPGEYDGTLTVDEDVEQFTVEITEPTLTIEAVDSNGPVNPADELDITVTLYNPGQESVTEELVVKGTDIGSEMVAVTVDGESETEETVTYDDITGLSEGEYELDVSTAADEAELSIEISEDASTSDDSVTDEGADDQGPGMGVAGALAGIASLSYVLKHRLTNDEQAEN